MSERNRAGVIHWGFGLQAMDLVERYTPDQEAFERVAKYGKEHNAPIVHSAHIHNHFMT
jgi:hypothetical protein